MVERRSDAWLMLATNILEAGGHVLCLDFDDDAETLEWTVQAWLNPGVSADGFVVTAPWCAEQITRLVDLLEPLGTLGLVVVNGIERATSVLGDGFVALLVGRLALEGTATVLVDRAPRP